MKKTLVLGSLALLMSACSSNAPVQQTQNTMTAEQSQSSARLRLYGQNQKPSIATVGIDCANGQKGTKINVGGGLGDAFGSMVGTAKSESLGMPDTDNSRSIGQRNGLLSKAFFREVAVPAGKAVNVSAPYIGLTTTNTSLTGTTVLQQTCRGNTGSFIPKAGHDYEVIGTKGASCNVAVFEVAKNGTLTPVPLAEEISCRKK